MNFSLIGYILPGFMQIDLLERGKKEYNEQVFFNGFPMYSQDNVFARILRKEIPCDFLIETEYTASFYDQSPAAPVHILVIPKGPYTDAFDFYHRASQAEILDFSQTLSQIILKFNLNVGGFKLVSNAKKFGRQEVFHFHVHVLGEKSEF